MSFFRILYNSALQKLFHTWTRDRFVHAASRPLSTLRALPRPLVSPLTCPRFDTSCLVVKTFHFPCSSLRTHLPLKSDRSYGQHSVGPTKRPLNEDSAADQSEMPSMGTCKKREGRKGLGVQ